MRFISLLCVLLCLPLQAQIVLTPVPTNPHLPASEPFHHKAGSSFLQLPFVDDFSNYEGYPTPLLWENNQAYVNKQYPVYPPTVGVATLDALDACGYPYAHASTSSFHADTLTSLPIRLDSLQGSHPYKLSPNDSLYFSFYYQPGGGYGKEWERIGSAPGKHDSLILDFYDALSDTWHTVWHTGGFPLDTLYARDSLFFKYVHIPILDIRFFQKGFRFRFRNIATLPNTTSPYFRNDGGQWHIDYVVLDRNRSYDKHSQKDIAFVQPAPTLLKTFQAMPARQFKASDMVSHLSIPLTNLHDEALSSQYKYRILTESGAVLHSYDGGVENIAPFMHHHSYQTSPNHAAPPVNYIFPVSANTPVAFKVQHLFQQGVSPDRRPQNDTIEFFQHFDNYFAYDDGSSENGFGIVPINNGRVAISYTLQVPDTLTAVDIYFNATTESDADNLFTIVIYSALNGLPHEELFQSEALSPIHDSVRNKFHRYVLPTGVLLPAEDFFVAIKQLTPAFMNLGFDRNNNASDKIFYNTSGIWENTFLRGAVMLRPCFGRAATVSQPKVEKPAKFSLYPNPSKGILRIVSPFPTYGYRIALRNIHGQELLNIPFQNELDLSRFPKGIYLLNLYHPISGAQHNHKLILIP